MVLASRLSKNVDLQVRRWVADEDKFKASVDDAQSIDFVIEKFVAHTEEDGETHVKARFAGWSAGFDVWFKVSELNPVQFNLARKFLSEHSTTPVMREVEGGAKKKKKKKGAPYTEDEDALLREWGVKVCSNDKNAPSWEYIAQHLFTERSGRALAQRFSTINAREDPARATEEEVLQNRSAIRKRHAAESRRTRSDAAKEAHAKRKSQRQATLDELLPEHVARASSLEQADRRGLV